MKFLWWFIGLSFLFTAAGMYSIMRGGARHEVERIIDVTVFTQPEQIGEALFRRNYPLYREAAVVVLASSVSFRDYDRIWLGFLKMARDRGFSPSGVSSEAGLRELSLSSAGVAGAATPVGIGSGPRVYQIVANDASLFLWRQKEPRALIIIQSPFDELRAKKINRAKLTASAEIDEQKNVVLFLNEPVK